MDLIKQSPKLDKDLRSDYFEPALHCSDYLMCIVNDILDFTKGDFDKDVRMVFEPCNIRLILKIVESMLKLRAKTRNIDLIIELD